MCQVVACPANFRDLEVTHKVYLPYVAPRPESQLAGLDNEANSEELLCNPMSYGSILKLLNHMPHCRLGRYPSHIASRAFGKSWPDDQCM